MPSTGKTGQPAFLRLPPNRTCRGQAKIDANDPKLKLAEGELTLNEHSALSRLDVIALLLLNELLPLLGDSEMPSLSLRSIALAIVIALALMALPKVNAQPT